MRVLASACVAVLAALTAHAWSASTEDELFDLIRRSEPSLEDDFGTAATFKRRDQSSTTKTTQQKDSAAGSYTESLVKHHPDLKGCAVKTEKNGQKPKYKACTQDQKKKLGSKDRVVVDQTQGKSLIKRAKKLHGCAHKYQSASKTYYEICTPKEKNKLGNKDKVALDKKSQSQNKKSGGNGKSKDGQTTNQKTNNSKNKGQQLKQGTTGNDSDTDMKDNSGSGKTGSGSSNNGGAGSASSGNTGAKTSN